jgi:hypothetical protein
MYDKRAFRRFDERVEIERRARAESRRKIRASDSSRRNVTEEI